VKAFAYVNPTSEKDAVIALKIDGVAMPIGGGQDILARMKDYITQPDRVVNIKNALDTTVVGIPGGGLKIGAAVKIVDLAANAQVRRLYPALSDAAGLVGTPQIRNQGTVGGNINQRPRCWYYRAEEFVCFKTRVSVLRRQRREPVPRHLRQRRAQPHRPPVESRGPRGRLRRAVPRPWAERRARSTGRGVLHAADAAERPQGKRPRGR